MSQFELLKVLIFQDQSGEVHDLSYRSIVLVLVQAAYRLLLGIYL